MAGEARWMASAALTYDFVSDPNSLEKLLLIKTVGFVRGSIEIFLDLAILTLPLPMLAKLNMSPKKKLQIMSMFCVGFIITVVSCLRLWSFVEFGQTTNPTCKRSLNMLNR